MDTTSLFNNASIICGRRVHAFLMNVPLSYGKKGYNYYVFGPLRDKFNFTLHTFTSHFYSRCVNLQMALLPEFFHCCILLAL